MIETAKIFLRVVVFPAFFLGIALANPVTKKTIEKAGFTRTQAATSIKMLIDLMKENFATKTDLTITENALRMEMVSIRSDLKELEYNSPLNSER